MTVVEDKNVIKLRPSKGENHIKNFDPYKIVMGAVVRKINIACSFFSSLTVS